jgi:hypothetical protein
MTTGDRIAFIIFFVIIFLFDILVAHELGWI